MHLKNITHEKSFYLKNYEEFHADFQRNDSALMQKEKKMHI